MTSTSTDVSALIAQHPAVPPTFADHVLDQVFDALQRPDSTVRAVVAQLIVDLPDHPQAAGIDLPPVVRSAASALGRKLPE